MSGFTKTDNEKRIQDGERLVRPAQTAAVLRAYQLTPQKKYGQNFLIDARVLKKIMTAAGVEKEDTVLEIGPGIGTLTQALAEKAAKVIAVEIDARLMPVLEENLRAYPHVHPVQADILKTDIRALLAREGDGRRIRVVANLPYYITTPIVMRLLEGHYPIESITVMVQKEVAERMRAVPGSKSYGALSLAVSYYAEAEINAYVPPNCFIPRPRVGSAVITLQCRRKPPVQVENEAFLFSLIRAAFSQRRKTLVNALAHGEGLCLSKEEVTAALKAGGFSEQIRGEALSLEAFAALANLLDTGEHR